MHSRTKTTMGFGILAALSVAAAAQQPTASGPKAWAISCALQMCVAVNESGDITFFDTIHKRKFQTGQLPKRPVAPVNIECDSRSAEFCLIVDASGQVWKGSPRGGRWVEFDKLPKRPVAPVNIGCDSRPADFCLIVDGSGQVWKGSSQGGEWVEFLKLP
jgi:hypothetical protein